MTAKTLIEKLKALRPLNVEGFGPVVFQKDLLAVVRQHEVEQQAATLCLTRPRFPASDAHEAKSLATQMQVEQAFHFAMQKCLPNWGDGDFVDGGNLLALISTAITALGRASETGIGSHASTAHLQDHALTPPASDADRSELTSGLLSMHIGTEMLPDEVMLAISSGNARPEDYGMKQVYPAIKAFETLSALLPQSAEGWLKIESAPRDGSTVLLHAPYDCVAGHWISFGNFGDDGKGINRWLMVDTCVASHGWRHVNPTHWMPMPVPPAGEQP